MLVIISDLHLTDGSSGETMSAGAFRLFRDRLRDLAYDASCRSDGTYRPIEDVHLVLLGDILDVIRSTQWLRGKNGDPSLVRPWDDYQSQPFVDKVTAINAAILRHNEKSLDVLRSLHDPRVFTVPRATPAGEPAPGHWEPDSPNRQPVKVHIYYLVGNHDWFYHLRDKPYNEIRKAVVDAIGLENCPDEPFPHDSDSSASRVFKQIQRVYDEHGVLARHGDIYDSANYEGARDASSLGDAVVVQLLDRFSDEVERRLKGRIPQECVDGLREIDNVRPLTMSLVWIAGLLRRTCPDPRHVKMVMQVWRELVADFYGVPFVTGRHPRGTFVTKNVWRLSEWLPLELLSFFILFFRSRLVSSGPPTYKNALKEAAFISRRARFVVYGHTHVYEMEPLQSAVVQGGTEDQIYINSGTWRPYHELALVHPYRKEFVRYQMMTYLAFFKDDERRGRRFESWTGVLGRPERPD